MPKLANELKAAGVTSKRWTARSGRVLGGVPMRCGAIYYLLQNRLYLGEVVHREVSHAGEHEAIVAADMFEAVQQGLAERRKERRARPSRAAECALTGIIVDADGKTMSPSFAYGRGGKMYRYYVSPGALPGTEASDSCPELARVPAQALDHFVLQLLVRLAGRKTPLPIEEARTLLTRVEIRERSIHLLLDLTNMMEPHEPADSILERLRGRVNDGRLVSDGGGQFRLICGRNARFRGGLADRSNSGNSGGIADGAKAKDLLKKAHQLLEQHGVSPIQGDFCQAEAPPYQRERRIMQLGLLAPDIQRRVTDGQRSIRADRIVALDEVPLA